MALMKIDDTVVLVLILPIAMWVLYFALWSI